MMSTLTPQFISFEGTEGVGKTTLIQGVAEHLRKAGIDFIQTREPGGSPFAEKLRELLLDPNVTMVEESELLLMFSARADHLANTILPALANNQWVLCDRFIDSSLAYQGFGRKHGDPSELAKVQQLIDSFVPRLPDTTIWLDLPVIEGMNRAKSRGKLDRFEQEQVAFFERVYQGLAYCHDRYPQRVKRIDASGSVEDVLQRVLTVI
ncbi:MULTISPECIES: dTMP kinase [unclassified Moraxella]|uniref:dTMP kinase n=1 Tax=unclassified Moraxella TaxID=2685852 RepID=UPI003AF5E13D